MWSQKQNANGARNQFYENMREVSPGDIVSSFYDARIKAVGVVRSPSACSLLTPDVNVTLGFRDAILVGEPPFPGIDGLAADGTDHGLGLAEEHSRPPHRVYACPTTRIEARQTNHVAVRVGAELPKIRFHDLRPCSLNSAARHRLCKFVKKKP